MAQGDIEATRDELRERLREVGSKLPEQIRRDIADKLSEELVQGPDAERNRGPIVPSPLDKNKYYVVPGDDMGFAETAIELTVGFLGALANPIPLLSAIALLIFQFRRKSVLIDARQAAVVLTLIKAPDAGWTHSEIKSHLPADVDLDVDAIRQILSDLKAMTRRGLPAPVVREFNGRWLSNEIW